MKPLSIAAVLLLAASAPAQIVHQGWEGGQDASWMGFAVESLGQPGGGRSLLIGQPLYDHIVPFANIEKAGIVRCHPGKDPGDVLWQKIGGAFDEIGRSLANVGDVNGDGFEDFATGAPYGSESASFAQEGFALVCNGKSGATLHTLVGLQEYSKFGKSVAGAGDINLDGVPDIVVGAPDYDVTSSGEQSNGRVYVFSGDTGALLEGYSGHDLSSLGWSVCGVGDVSGDGRADFAAGAPSDDTTALEAGRVVVLLGGFGIMWQDLPGKSTQDSFGWDLASGGDFDDDGALDLVVGSPGVGSNQGRVEVRRGPAFTKILDSWFSPTENDRLGTAVDFAGDIDKDGYDDVVMSASQINGEVVGPGRVECHSGKTGALILSPQLGVAFGDDFGGSVAGAGDADGDGWEDVLIGAPFSDKLATDAGSARLIGWQVVQPDVGGGGVGSTQLDVFGSALASGYAADLVISGGPKLAPAWLLVSALQQPLPFKGGTLVPGLGASLILPFPLNALGGGSALVPGGGGPFSVYVQGIVQDATQAADFQLTSCVRIDFLP